MIKFFRKIRQNMIKENRTSKYLLYAIGEIVLVVIGILIALQVNNLNESSKNDVKAEKFLMKLKNQIERNIETVELQQAQNNQFLEISERLISLTNTNSGKNIETKLDTLVLVNSFDFNLNLDMLSLSEARNNGDLDLVKSDSLTLNIYKFIKLYDDLMVREKVTNEDLTMNFKPYLNKHYNVRNLVYMNGYPELKKSTFNQKKNIQILSDQVFENLLVTRFLFLIDIYELNESLLQLLKKINTELQLITND
tara:strand:- start:313 stop:1068 length:756 start_codon:yes stop_codon:yes gene_type:complete